MVGPNQFPDERDLPGFSNAVRQYRDQMKPVGYVKLIRSEITSIKVWTGLHLSVSKLLLWPITMDATNAMNQSQLEVKTTNRC